ncbi:MAG: sulfatase-like hydrolase/transferase [Candidatus Sumerlaeaceae bacterium]|nr:sulfatase-like hydrolase/transferase [Candidatus Sumerlaeaceae bacterium]
MERTGLASGFCLAAMLASTATIAAPKGTTSATVERNGRPNIIFVLSDDVGIGNIGCYGSDNFKTPRIDALAKSGTRFTRCYSAPLCGPSRAQALTGRYPFRTGMTSNETGQSLKPANEVMIPTILKSAGYVTAAVGKWSQLPLQPGDWGFDEYWRFQGSGKYWKSQGGANFRNGESINIGPDQYIPDLMHGFIVDFMTRHKDQPFYIHYAMSHMHGQILKTPDSKPGSKDFYADNNRYMDKLVGQLVQDLEKLGLRENTLIIFVGDNGTAQGGVARATVKGRPLSGQKGTMLEGGSHVPMIASWPGRTAAGKVSDTLVDFTDFLPTFAELAGAKLPEGVKIDGHSLAPMLLGKSRTPREWIYVELGGKWFAESQNWKLNKGGQLFDMKDAPYIEKPVSADTTDTEALAARKQLRAVLDELNPAAGKQSGATGKAGNPRQRREAGAAVQTTGSAVRPNRPLLTQQERQTLSPQERKKLRAQRQAQQQAAGNRP